MPMKYPEALPPSLLIVEDVGIAWGMGAFGGGIYAGVKGFRNSPRGDKLSGAWTAMRMRGPIYGGNFAVWGGLYTMSDLLLQRVRGATDGWNSVMAGAVTGGALAARAGWSQFYRNAIIGGMLLGVIEGFSLMMGGFRQGEAFRTGHKARGPMEGVMKVENEQLRGRKSNWRTRQVTREVPLYAPRWLRNFRLKYDQYFGPWKNVFPDDPIAYWMGKTGIKRVKRNADMRRQQMIVPHLPERVNYAVLAIAREREALWDEYQAPVRERKPFEIEPEFSATPPAVPPPIVDEDADDGSIFSTPAPPVGWKTARH